MDEKVRVKQKRYFGIGCIAIIVSLVVCFLKMSESVKLLLSNAILIIGELFLLYACTRTSILDRSRLAKSIKRYSRRNTPFTIIDDYNECKTADIYDKVMHINHVYMTEFYSFNKNNKVYEKKIKKRDKRVLAKRRVYLQYCLDMENGLDEYLKQLVTVIFLKFLLDSNRYFQAYSIVVVIISALVYAIYYFYIRGLKQNNLAYLHDYEIRKIDKLMEDIDIPQTDAGWRKYKNIHYRHAGIDYNAGKDIEFK